MHNFQQLSDVLKKPVHNFEQASAVLGETVHNFQQVQDAVARQGKVVKVESFSGDTLAAAIAKAKAAQ